MTQPLTLRFDGGTLLLAGGQPFRFKGDVK